MTEPMFAGRDDRQTVELGTDFAPRFGPDGLIPAVVTDYETGELLMQAFMNAEALAVTIRTGEGVYFSRSRQKLWHKGESSGNVQKVREIRTDCDQDCIWLRVEQIGGAACHNGYRSCFYRRVPFGEAAANQAPLPLEYTESERVFDPDKVYG